MCFSAPYCFVGLPPLAFWSKASLLWPTGNPHNKEKDKLPSPPGWVRYISFYHMAFKSILSCIEWQTIFYEYFWAGKLTYSFSRQQTVLYVQCENFVLPAHTRNNLNVHKFFSAFSQTHYEYLELSINKFINEGVTHKHKLILLKYQTTLEWKPPTHTHLL